MWGPQDDTTFKGDEMAQDVVTIEKSGQSALVEAQRRVLEFLSFLARDISL